jgi:VWFA-related protein
MRLKVSTLARFIFVGLLLLSAAASAQDYKIRAKIDLVVVPVTVKASNDKLITGLQQDDFVVLESGGRQTITNFSVDPVPLSAAVIIDMGLSAGSLEKIQQTFPALAGAFSEFDEVAVYRYNKFVTKVLDFSKENERVETAMKSLREIKPDAGQDTTLDANNLLGGPFSIPGPVINGQAVVPPGQLGIVNTIPPRPSRVLHDAIFEAANDLATRERSRRRIVLVISDGLTSGNDHTFDQTRQALLEKNVEVYAVGLDQPFPYKKVSVLDDYAKSTGGDVYFADSLQHIERSYAAATEQARNQYVLAYISTNEVIGTGPVFRDIVVEISGRNLKTIHRKGYYQYP